MNKREIVKAALEAKKASNNERKSSIQAILDVMENATFKQWNKNAIIRIYASIKGQSIGYFESKKINQFERKGSSVNVWSDSVVVSDDDRMNDLHEALSFTNSDDNKRNDISVEAQNLCLGLVGY